MGVFRYVWWEERVGVVGNGALTSVISSSVSGAGSWFAAWLGLAGGSGDGLRGPKGRRSDLSEELRDRERPWRSGLPGGDCARTVGVVDLVDVVLWLS